MNTRDCVLDDHTAQLNDRAVTLTLAEAAAAWFAACIRSEAEEEHERLVADARANAREVVAQAQPEADAMLDEAVAAAASSADPGLSHKVAMALIDQHGLRSEHEQRVKAHGRTRRPR